MDLYFAYPSQFLISTSIPQGPPNPLQNVGPTIFIPASHRIASASLPRPRRAPHPSCAPRHPRARRLPCARRALTQTPRARLAPCSARPPRAASHKSSLAAARSPLAGGRRDHGDEERWREGGASTTTTATTTRISTGSNAAARGEVVYEAEHLGRIAVNAAKVAVDVLN